VTIPERRPESVTATARVVEEGAKDVLPPYETEMVLAPMASWLPATLRLAVAVPPDPERVAVPSDFWPKLNEIVQPR